MFHGFRFFFRYCWKQQKSYILLLLAGEIFQAVVFVCSIIYPKHIINSIFERNDIQSGIQYVVIFLCIVMVSNFMAAVTRYYAERSRDQMYRKFSIDYAKRIMETEYQNLENPDYLNLKENALRCIAGNYGFAGTILLAVNLVGKILLVGSIVTIVATLDGFLLIIFAVLIAISVIVNNKIGEKNIKLEMDKAPNQRREDYFHRLGDEPEFGKEIRLNHLHHWIIELYQEEFDTLHKYTRRKNYNTCVGACTGSFSTFLQQGVAYIYLILKVIRRGLSMGGFTMYLNAILSFNASITDILTIVARLKQCTSYLIPFEQFMGDSLTKGREMTKEESRKVKQQDSYTIQFKNVSFHYPGQKKNALSNITCTIHPGEKIAIVGENGAGKSTFIKLLTGLYAPTEGQIQMNGQDIRSMDDKYYKSLFAVVFQDFKLFAATLKENILFNTGDDIHREELDALIQKLGLENRVRMLPKKLDTPVYKVFEEDGFEPSGGEAQKIAMARAFVKNAPFILLDEPTASLDPRAEYELYQDFSQLTHNRTAIYISHRLASCKLCDRILVFQDGRIVESGTHLELMQNNGSYAATFKTQSSWYHEEVNMNA